MEKGGQKARDSGAVKDAGGYTIHCAAWKGWHVREAEPVPKARLAGKRLTLVMAQLFPHNLDHHEGLTLKPPVLANYAYATL